MEAYLEGSHFDDYLHDSRIAGEYATLNRHLIGERIIKAYFGNDKGLDDYEHFETDHNYIDTDDMVIRKGAISAHDGEIVLIPISMKDGALICRGKGNADYNMSAPHGAGRICSRADSKNLFTVNQFKKDMNGVFSVNINKEGLSESPMVYKRIDYIKESLSELIIIEKILKPIFNYKN